LNRDELGHLWILWTSDHFDRVRRALLICVGGPYYLGWWCWIKIRIFCCSKHHHGGVRYYIDIEFGTERKRDRENMERRSTPKMKNIKAKKKFKKNDLEDLF